jgi:spore maturation protein CgeB
VGRDFLMARNGEHMQSLMRQVLNDADLARELSSHGRETILNRHTCGHRVEQLLSIYEAVRPVSVGVAVGTN